MEYHSDAEESQLGWLSFHQEKIEIEDLRKQLLNMYVDYRSTQVEALREFCS